MSETLSAPDIAKLLGVSRARVWQLAKREDFPSHAGRQGGRDYWYDTAILRWAARSGRDLADKAPLLYRPTVPVPVPRYLHARSHQGYVVLVWHTDVGEVGITYDFHHVSWFSRMNPVRTLLEATGCDTVVHLSELWDAFGPEATAIDKHAPERSYHVAWDELAPRLGGKIPWWPSPLRRVEDMMAWRPGGEPIPVPAVPDVDTAPLLRAAADAADGSAVRLALSHMAGELHEQSADSARRDLEMMDKPELVPLVEIAAVPAPVSTTPEPDLDTVEAAWAQILQRSDRLAAECVNAAMAKNSGTDFPFSARIEIDKPLSAAAVEWSSRLEDTRPCAAFEIVRHREQPHYRRDPLTGAPVSVSDSGSMSTAAPHRLPTTSPLAELILDKQNTPWIRTQDGELYPAPQRAGAGLSWGYRGTGPSTLALTIERLLADPASPAVRANEPKRSSPGLNALMQQEWPAPTVLTRAQLEAALRRGSTAKRP